MDNDRIIHSLAVANKMIEIGKTFNLNNEELEDLFIIGYNHDIGYQFCAENIKHNVIGGNILKNNGYKYWKEIYYHGNSESNYKSLYLTILNMADMQIDKFGNDVGYKKRLEDIKMRYNENSEEYKNAYIIISKLKMERSCDYNE